MFEFGEAISITHLAYLVFQSVFQVVIICLAGFWSAYMGLLPKQSQKVVSLLNVDLFTPCLIFSKLAKYLSLAKILEISIIPLFFALSTSISYISGRFISNILKLDVDETNFVVANSIFGNSNSLPVSLTLSLAYTLPNLTWDQIPDDNRNNVASRGILYLLIFQQIGQMLRWSWGYNKLMKWTGENHHHMPQSQIQAHLEASRQNANPYSDEDGDDNGNAEDGINDLIDAGHQNGLNSVLSRIGNNFIKFVNVVRSYLNPPLYAMIISVIVASIPSLQNELFMEDSFMNNTFSSAITQIGSVSIPLILIVLGSNLYPSDDTFPRTHNHDKIVMGALIGRLILPSCILLPIITILVKYIKVSILDDPIFLIVGFLLTVSPPAIQLTQITQLNEFFEAEMASVLFWGYVVFSLPVSIIVITAAIYVLQWADS
ncbi:hypothetical protein Kpol_1018p3 [Vanderwaltozyma polyspora DSM 70294]|uniref:Uncharacterized protein n=1 Tax=Vanderwaltozyma polyspora (strain ATCC 22028 / DSM 70294 / BCRC 21397 / CBS 2163 / NBRC 10782 / NRRL Y-8283 / UCD 57-17) TaxID=436907 RepID=A7TDK6_VANPO|nr:uncharacterized protein Kpol_1018p3 [Vanderwaltozyma polyspora DSM 70294]EDO19476.1 hypothetical protein Kpol_1018p3 [Vanderwaltozyma polyspora DSM 70294]